MHVCVFAGKTAFGLGGLESLDARYNMKQLSRSVEVPHALKSQAAQAVQVLSQKSLKHGHGAWAGSYQFFC